MKIEIQQEDLQQAVSVVANVVAGKTTMPILTCILMEVGAGVMKLSATNLDISIMTTTDKVEIKKEGRAAIPASKFISFVRNLVPGKVKIEDKKGKISVISGKASLEEPGMNVEEFPVLPALAKGQTFEMDASSLAAMIRQTSYSVSRDETRPALMGVLWEVRPDSITLVATDAHRLAKSQTKQDWEVSQDHDVIVDTQGLNQLVRLAEGQEKVLVCMGENQLSFELGPTILHTRLMEGPFPDFRAVIPQNNDKIVTVDRETFIQAIRRVSITADRITSQIRLGIDQERMELSATGTDGSRAEDEIAIAYTAEPMEIGFNFVYLQDILKNIDAESIQLFLNDSQSAALIEPVPEDKKPAGGSLLCLLMPLRLTSD